MLTKYAYLQRMCDDITDGFSVQPEIETGKILPNGDDRVGANFKLNRLVLELRGSMVGGSQNSMFIYRWDLANSFCVSPDIDFARHLGSLKFGCDATDVMRQCETFRTNAIYDRLLYYQKKILCRIEKELLSRHAKKFLCHITGCDNVLDAYNVLGDSKYREEHCLFSEFIPENFPWYMKVDITKANSELYPYGIGIHVTASDDISTGSMTISHNVNMHHLRNKLNIT